MLFICAFSFTHCQFDCVARHVLK